MFKLMRWVLFACVMVSASAFGADAISTSNAWVRASIPGQDVGAAYLDMKSVSDLKLIKVTTPVAGSVELHSMTMDNGVMKMRMLEEMALPAGKTVSLSPGGFHFMLFDLNKPLKAGESVVFTLSAKNAQGKVLTQQISLPVKAGKD